MRTEVQVRAGVRLALVRIMRLTYGFLVGGRGWGQCHHLENIMAVITIITIKNDYRFLKFVVLGHGINFMIVIVCSSS